MITRYLVHCIRILYLPGTWQVPGQSREEGLVAFRLFPLSPSSLLLFFFASLLSLVDSVLLVFRQRYIPPALFATLKYAYTPCLLSSCVHDDFFFFSSLRSLFSISICTSFVSSCHLLVGTMRSRFRLLLRLVQHTYHGTSIYPVPTTNNLTYVCIPTHGLFTVYIVRISYV